MICAACSTENAEGDPFCSSCGMELVPTENEESPEAMPQQPVSPEALEEYKFLTLPKAPIAVTSSGATHIGLVKENNEDAYIVQVVEYPLHNIAVHVAVVADGMGSPPAGEVFAQIAVHEIWLGLRFLLPYFEQQENFTKWEFWKYLNTQIEKHLTVPVATANARTIRYTKAKQLPVGSCGTTIVLAVAICDLETGHVTCYGYNEGDARCLLVSEAEAIQLSRDHTIGGAPFRFLGRHDHLGGHIFKHETWFSEASFDSFGLILYTDGYWNMLNKNQILATWKEFGSRSSFCKEAISQALRVEAPDQASHDDRVTVGDDNITVAVINFQRKE